MRTLTLALLAPVLALSSIASAAPAKLPSRMTAAAVTKFAQQKTARFGATVTGFNAINADQTMTMSGVAVLARRQADLPKVYKAVTGKTLERGIGQVYTRFHGIDMDFTTKRQMSRNSDD